MPCFDDGVTTLHPEEAALVDASRSAPRVPPGYVRSDTHVPAVRNKWLPASTLTSVATWLTDSVFKYSMKEIMARASTAEAIQGQVRECRDEGLLHRRSGRPAS